MSTAHAAWLTQRAQVRQARDRRRATLLVPDVAVDFAGNDYLGLAHDERLVAAAQEALARTGVGARASRVVCGTFTEHQDLEDALSALTGAESAVVFSSGYTANLGALTSLAGPGCTIVLDEHAHASLHDAARLARSTVVLVPHNDVGAVDQALANSGTPRAMVVTESVFSVLGDAAPLVALHEVASRHDALLVVDEAHGVGVRGHGAGLVAECGLAGDPQVVITATLSKALGAQGGAVLGSAAIREHVVNEARSFIFDTALAPSLAAAAAVACRVVATEPTLVERLHVVARQVAQIIGVPASAGAVQSLPMPSPHSAFTSAQQCAQRGVLVGCFRPPAVPDGIARLRFTARANTTDDELDVLRQVCEHIAPERSAPPT